MAFLKELESKKDKLRKVDTPKEQKHIDKLLFENDDDYIRLLRETNFENYYSLIEEFTFKSVIISLTTDEIKALYEENVGFGNNPVDISNKLFPSLNGIEDKINEGIRLIQEKTKNPSSKCFLRLSTRSPKDAIFHMNNFPDLYASKLKQVTESDSVPSHGKTQIYDKLMAFYLASTEILSISEGSQGIKMLVVSNRIQGDLKMYVEMSEPLNLIIREFVQFPVEHELRGFVWKKHLTALSQYNNIAFLPSLVKNKVEIEAKVKTFMEKFIQIVGEKVENFVVDIVLDYDGKVWVVELNPFGELAGSCLFSWITDRDLLLNEDGRYEFRIQETPPELTYIKGELSEKVISFLDI
jgi:hypothetical protein